VNYGGAIVNYLTSMSYATNAVADIRITQNLILGSCGIALALGFVWMVIMKACAGVITWSIILVTLTFCFWIS
jgi:hypothetical protein